MIIELLLVLLILLVVLLFLIFFKSWHIHIIFKINNADYFYRIVISFLIFNLIFFTRHEIGYLKVQITIFSKTLDLFDIKLNDGKEDSSQEDSSKEESQQGIENNQSEENSTEEDDLLDKITEAYPLLYDERNNLYSIIKMLVRMLKFDESWITMNLGLSDNNLTIKICSLLWTLSAPLYPVGLRVYLTPEINKTLIKTDTNVKFDVLLFNILKILSLVVQRKKLRDTIKIFMK